MIRRYSIAAAGICAVLYLAGCGGGILGIKDLVDNSSAKNNADNSNAKVGQPAANELTVYATGNYEVWASNETSPHTGNTNVDYYNVNKLSGYSRIGTASGTSTFGSSYRWYVIATTSVMHLDAIKIPDGTYPSSESNDLGNYLSWGNVHLPFPNGNFAPGYTSDTNIYGAPDGKTDDVGFEPSAGSTGGSYTGFVIVRNPIH